MGDECGRTGAGDGRRARGKHDFGYRTGTAWSGTWASTATRLEQERERVSEGERKYAFGLVDKRLSGDGNYR